jgi:hypothetical protein
MQQKGLLVQHHHSVVRRFTKGPAEVKCNHCNHVFRGSTTRIAGHFLCDPTCGTRGCSNAPADLVQALSELQAADIAKAERKRKFAELQRAAQTSSCASQQSKQPSIGAAFAACNKASVDLACAKFFTANGIAFNVARSPYFQEFVREVAKAGPGYSAPKYDR